MAASIVDLLDRVTDSTTGRPIIGELGAPGKAIAAASINIASATNWTTTTAIHFSIYQTTTVGSVVVKDTNTQTDWKGTLAGTTISNLTITGGTDRAYSAGAIVEITPTARWAKDMYDWAIAQHKQNGTHGTVTADSVDGVIMKENGINLQTIRSDIAFDFVANGCVWTADAPGTNMLGSMTAGVVYIGGKRVPVSSVAAHSYTALHDTYVFVDNTGALTYTTVTNNATSPALPANSLLLAIIVTGATTIAAATDINQGQENRGFPVISSTPLAVTDSNGVLICPRDPNRKILGLRQISSDFTSATTPAATDITGLSVPVIIPTGRKIKVSVHSRFGKVSGAAGNGYDILVLEGATTKGRISQTNAGVDYATPINVSATYTPATTSLTFKAQFIQAAAGTFTLSAGATYPAYILVELV